jgi:hypothetical protein
LGGRAIVGQVHVASELAAVTEERDVFTHWDSLSSRGRQGFGPFKALAVKPEGTRTEAFLGDICPRQAAPAGETMYG